MVQHLVDRAIIERRAQGNCRYDWVCVLAAWHWFSFSNELCITSCVVLRPSDEKNSDVIALLNCVLVCRGSWHGHAKQFVRDFMASCYFLCRPPTGRSGTRVEKKIALLQPSQNSNQIVTHKSQWSSVYYLCSFLLLPPPPSVIPNRYIFGQLE